MLVVGNVYGHGFGDAALADLERAGFALSPRTLRYAGSQVCRFLDFEEGPSLELIRVGDEKAYLDFVPNGMKPYTPGVSLVVPAWAERDLAYHETRAAALRPYRLHVNYDGTDGAGKPGWSYLNFATPVIRDTFLWLTQLEEPRPFRPDPPPHPNGARGVRGLVFDVDAADLSRLAGLAEVDVVDGAVDVDGVSVWSRDAVEGLPPMRDKVFPLRAVVVETEGLGGLPRSLRENGAARFGSRPAVHLRTNDLSWDLLVTGPWPADARRRARGEAAPGVPA